MIEKLIYVAIACNCVASYDLYVYLTNTIHVALKKKPDSPSPSITVNSSTINFFITRTVSLHCYP